MRDVIAMWRSTKMVVLVALSAALYAAILIPFKPIPIITLRSLRQLLEDYGSVFLHQREVYSKHRFVRVEVYRN